MESIYTTFSRLLQFDCIDFNFDLGGDYFDIKKLFELERTQFK